MYVPVFNACIRSLMKYSSSVFLGCGKCLNNKLLRICKRAFRVIQGDGISCGQLDTAICLT